MDLGVHDMVHYSKHGETDTDGLHGLHAKNEMEGTQPVTPQTAVWSSVFANLRLYYVNYLIMANNCTVCGFCSVDYRI
jgi:hypothetical protein